MDEKLTAIERAFQLAQSGKVSGFSEIVQVLKLEGYSVDQLEGPSLRQQLTDLIKAAHEKETRRRRPF